RRTRHGRQRPASRAPTGAPQTACGPDEGAPVTPDVAIQRVTDTSGRPAWLVSGHERVRQLLGDPRLTRSHPNPGHPVRLTQPGLFGGAIPDPQGERADHQRMRKLLAPSFSARRMESLRPRVEARSEER